MDHHIEKNLPAVDYTSKAEWQVTLNNKPIIVKDPLKLLPSINIVPATPSRYECCVIL